MIESILEHHPWTTAATLGTLSTTSGSAAVVGVGTSFLAEAPAGTILLLTDDAGVLRTYQVASVADNTNLTLEENALSAATGVSFRVISSSNLTAHFFRADNTSLKKPIVTIPQASGILKNTGNDSQISVNEGVLLKSLYVRFPYQYPMADTPFEIVFTYRDNTGANQGGITVFGNNTVYLPNENIEIPINLYIPPLSNALTTNTWQIAALINQSVANAGVAVSEANTWLVPQISQIDGPDSLNGLYIPVYVGARILHGIELT